jgi:hypothetical protein
VKEPTIKIMGIIGQASGLLGFQVCWTRGSPKFDQGLSLTCSMVSMVSSLIHPKVSWFSRTCRFSSPVGWCYRKPIVFPGFFPLSGDSIDISHPKSLGLTALGSMDLGWEMSMESPESGKKPGKTMGFR